MSSAKSVLLVASPLQPLSVVPRDLQSVPKIIFTTESFVLVFSLSYPASPPFEHEVSFCRTTHPPVVEVWACKRFSF